LLLPCRIVLVLDAQFAAPRVLAPDPGIVTGHQLADHDACRPTVTDDMMHHIDQHPLPLSRPVDIGAQQRPFAQIEYLCDLPAQQLREPALSPLRELVADIPHAEAETGMSHHLADLAVTSLAEHRPQDLMTLHELLQARLQRILAELSFQDIDRRNIVGAVAFLQLAQHPKTPLCRRQRMIRGLRYPRDLPELHPLATLYEHSLLLYRHRPEDLPESDLHAKLALQLACQPGGP